MMHFRGGYLALSAIALLAACKQRVPQDADQLSITAPGQIAGKWLATLTIGDGIAKYEAELLANTLKSFFLTERGGKYASAFNLSDKSGWSPSKSEIVAKFASLRQSIAAFRANNPSAPTMVAIGLTGHGVSRDVFSEVKNGYSFSVKAGRSPSEPVQDFSGVELAEIISSLGADEVLVFVQSCNSGNLSNTDFMNKYARTLASESARQNTNIAVITPVSEYLLSPTKVIERVYKKAFDRLAKAQTDVVTYATFKDQFVLAVCEEEEFFYPRSEIKSATAVKAAADLYEIETLIGIDPQFYESIDPSLPLFLTNTGLLKYRNGSLKLSSRQPPVSNVPVSAETRQFCASQVAKRARIFARMESDRLLNLELAQPCYSSADKERCLNDVREMRNGYKPVAIEPALKEGEGIDEGIVIESPFPTPPPPMMSFDSACRRTSCRSQFFKRENSKSVLSPLSCQFPDRTDEVILSQIVRWTVIFDPIDRFRRVKFF